MKFEEEFAPSLAGSLLVAHPSLADPNFRRKVILLSSHTKDTGSMGVIVNIPIHVTMGEYLEDYGSTPLANIPLFDGGPMDKQKLILAAWLWSESSNVFRLEFGISEEQAIQMINTMPEVEIRGFIGYAGWAHGQLEKEITQHNWLVSSVRGLTNKGDKSELWRNILAHIKPDLLFLADSPEDPAEN